MHYQTQYRADPNIRNGRKLKNYVVGNAVKVVDSVGMEPTEQQLEQFSRAAGNSAETRQHTISMMTDYDPEQLAEWGQAVAKESLDGEFMIGIHDDGDAAEHIHIAEYTDEIRGTDFDIFQFRESAENHIDDPPAW